MKILVDTNILIYREDQKVLGRDLQRLLKLINKRKGFEIVVVVDVKRDFDNLENLRNYVWKRAVFYEEEDLKNFVQGQAISFIFIGCFNEFPLSKVGEPYPQSIKQISHKTYLRIKEEWENESFTFS